MRPLEWPIMAGHTALGYLLAVGFAGAAAGAHLGAALTGLFAWVICLNGGTLALNSAFDNDTGDIAYLRSPPPPPRNLAGFGLALMAVGQVLALLLPRGFAVAYAACFAMSILYSVPPFRLKAVAGADWVINMWGFGTLTAYAGWAATGLPVPAAGILVLLAFCPLFAALYPLTQLYQVEEDELRGDRTLALRLGTGRSLDVAIVSVLLAFVLFVAGGLRSEWAAESATRWALLAVSFATWLAVLVPWRLRQRRMTPAGHQRGMYLALAAWAVTDIAVALCWAA